MADQTILAWLDLETTGADEHNDPILELGLVLTDEALNEIELCNAVVKTDREAAFDRAADVVKEMHTVNGLWDDLENGLPLDEVEQSLVSFLKRHGKKHDFVLCGSGVSHFDRRFLQAQLPRFTKWFRYYSIDVGVLRRSLELIGRADALMEKQEKTHRALDDARLHAEEMRHIKKVLAQ